MNQKGDHRSTYVFTYMMHAFLDAKQHLQEEMQRLGLSSVNDVTLNQFIINSFEKNFNKLSAKDDHLSNDYFEDTLNLTLSNYNQTQNNSQHDNHHPDNHRPDNHHSVLNELTNNNQESNFLFKLNDRDNDKENLSEDVLLKIPNHFDTYLTNLITRLKDALETNANNELKMLRERNIELINQLKGESNAKDNLVKRLMETENQAQLNEKRLENYEDDLKNVDDLRKENDNLKHQMRKYNLEYRSYVKDKEELEKNRLLFNNNLPDLEKKLKCDLEQARLQIEMVEKQRDDVLNEYTKLKAEKSDLEELNLKLRKDLELLKDNFDNEIKASQKQLENQKKYIDLQIEDRESEIENYMTRLNELETKLKDKETKEVNYIEKIKHLEEQNEMINDEKDQLDKCYEETCNRLTIEIKKNKQLQETLEEIERTKKQIEQVKKELEQRIAGIEEALNNQLKINETLIKERTNHSKNIMQSFVDNLCDVSNLDNVEQLRCSSATYPSLLFNDHSNLIQQTINEKQLDNQLSSLSIQDDSTFQDAKKLEEKNLSLFKHVQNFVKSNNDLNDELNEARRINESLDNKIASLTSKIDKYKADLEKMYYERTVLQGCIDEKNVKLSELQKQLEERKNEDNNEDNLRQSIECLERRLEDEERKVKELNEKVRRTESKLGKKQDENYRILKEIEQAREGRQKVEQDFKLLTFENKKLSKERQRLLQEIEELQNENDDLDDRSDLCEMFETVLSEKNGEIDNLTSDLNEINFKLRECLPASRIGQSNLVLLDELISLYQKAKSKYANHHLFNQKNQQPIINRLESESYDSLSPIESLNDDNHLTQDELNEDEFDDEIRNKLAGIHNNSLEICNLSIYLKNEKSLINLINEISDIVTNERLTRKEIAEWQASFVDCFSKNKKIGQLLAKNIITLRPIYLDCQTQKLKSELNNEQLLEQLEICKVRLRKESLEFRRCNSKRKALIFQKKYLTNLSKSLATNKSHHRHHQASPTIHQLTSPKYHQKLRTNVKQSNRFKIVASAVIASIRLSNMKRIRDLFESNDQIELINKIDQFKLKNNLMPSIKPTAEKFSSFINSLNPHIATTKEKVPPSDHHNRPNHHHPDYLHNHYLLTAKNKKPNHEPRLQDLYDNLKQVNQNLGLQSSSLSSSLSASSCFSNFD